MTAEAGRMTRAAGVVGFFTLLSRVTGLLRDIVVGYLFGAHGAADAFFVAFRIPNMLRRLTAEGALTVGFIPVFSKYLAQEGRAEAVEVARIILTFVALFVGAIALLGILFADPIVRLFAPGFLENPEQFALTVFLTRLMFPYILFVSLVALAMGILNTLRHFMAPALSPVLFNLCIVACAIVLSPFLSAPVSSLAYGILIGGLAQLLLQVPFLRRHGVSPAFNFNFKHPALRRLLFLMGPAAFGAAVYQVNVLVSTMLATLLPTGSVSYLYYADRLLEFPVGVFAVALGTAALPSFSILVARKDMAELRATIAHSLRLVNFVALPAAAGLIVVAVPVFAIFFQRGAFDADATIQTAQALVYYGLGLWGLSAAKVLAPVFYAMEDTRTPVRAAFWSFVINLILSLMLMGEVDPGADSGPIGAMIASLSGLVNVFSLGHGGLALATSISSTFNCLMLLFILRRRLEGFPLREVFRSFWRNLLNASLMALPLGWLIHRVDWIGGGRDLVHLGALFLGLFVIGVLLYLGLSRWLGSPEWPLFRDQLGRIGIRAFNEKRI